MARAAANTTETNNDVDNGAITVQPAAQVNFIEQIGTLTYPRAVARFGKDRAVGVMKRVAQIGGHGIFEDAELTSPMFGGLAMPNPENVIKPKREEFDKLPEEVREFYYQEAMDAYKLNQEKAASDLAKINEYYNSLQ